ncbi:hypothetical protein ACFY19_39685 [Streptosporangium saharense]|uniref:ABC-type transporter Mla subunit MlaD n=1 Tax=Streptosporangium saharense TaxID=1706840 RepID=A0A7W7QRZ5_9ACTN|nr:hypothetical protein [Streptosporangium saharense]MBB4918692.1 ABC-type transporter Mla subunit MlaD [Streptosporangium saharense]
MAGIDYNYDALEQCRTTVKKLVGRFGDLGDPYPAKGTDSTMFGRLTDASNLATALDGIEKTIDEELANVTGKLKDVEHALNDIEDNVRTANRAGGAG